MPTFLYLLIAFVVIGFVMWVINTYIPMSAGIKKFINVFVLVVCVIIALIFLFNLIGWTNINLSAHHRY
jgi:uncharacterized membrane protein YdbT with pleckstrin-like domain